MTFEEFENLISPVRLAKYHAAYNRNKRKTLSLYRANTRVSGELLAIIGMFEVVLRNKIDNHYRRQYPANGGHEWLYASTQPGGFLAQPGCHNSLRKINEAYTDLGARYTHDKLVASLSFGFWKFLFKGHQFMAGGNTLLSIFPNKPPHTNQGVIFAKLDKINELRNRVAHHEPICFDRMQQVSTSYIRTHFREIEDLLAWMNITATELFRGIDGVMTEADFIDAI